MIYSFAKYAYGSPMVKICYVSSAFRRAITHESSHIRPSIASSVLIHTELHSIVRLEQELPSSLDEWSFRRLLGGDLEQSSVGCGIELWAFNPAVVNDGSFPLALDKPFYLLLVMTPLELTV